MNDLGFAIMFVAGLFVFSFFAKKYHISKSVNCEIINEMVKYCINEKGQRVRV